EKLVLGIGNVLTADITTHLEDNELMMLIDVDKLLTYCSRQRSQSGSRAVRGLRRKKRSIR
ncbi:MAG: hypothetical protein IKR51_07035, partial [Oscillospiraceae bacterium]|nr:hypothetical protein [Oscillospiraceae bacterium]